MTHRALVLFNPGAARANDETRARLIDGLGGPEHCEVVDVPEEGDVLGLLEAPASRATHLVAAGGDGTVSALLPLAMRTGLPVLVVPLGTSSSLANALGIRDLDHAVSLLASPGAGRVRRIDVALVNRRPMVLLMALGLHADAIGGADPSLKAAVGPAAYLAWFAGALARAEHFELGIEVGQARFSCECTAITVANAARPAALLAQGTGDVRVDDGLLDVTVVLAKTPAELLAAGIELVQGALTGEGVEGRSVLAFRASELTLRPTTPRPLLVDGELLGEPLEVRIEVLPGALNVVTPADG